MNSASSPIDAAFRIVIPARYASTRLPGKPLADIAGQPMIVRVAAAARRSGADGVWVATDDERIAATVRQHGFEAVMTSANHASGTDRIAEVADQLQWDDADIVVNVQGDEPLLDPALIETVARSLRGDPDAAMATAAHPFAAPDDFFNPNVVKVVVLSDLYMANNDYGKAKDLLLAQIKASPEKTVPLYLALAKVEAILQKSPNGAKETYLKALQTNPDNPQILMALAGLYEQTGNVVDARQTYEKVIEKNQDAALAINNLAAILLESDKKEDLKKGLELAERFKNNENVFLQDTYAWALVKNENAKEGLAVLEGLILKEPKLAELRYHLGMAHLANNNKATAIIELKQAIALSEKQQRSFSGKNVAIKTLKELEH